MPGKGQKKPWPFLDPVDPQGMPALLDTWLDALRTRGYSEAYLQNHQGAVSAFILWCQERGLAKAAEVTKPIIERYQRFLFYYRRPKRGDAGDGIERSGARRGTASGELEAEGEPLGLRTQKQRLAAIKHFFRWLGRNSYILANPASEIELPRVPPRKPPEVLTLGEVEQVLAQPDITTLYGLRDRAILETLYSTGMRRKELSLLAFSDIQSEAGILRVRHGKGKKQRIIPIGERALGWIRRYLADVRPQLATTPDDGTLFLSFTGKPFWPDSLTQMARDYVKKAGIKKPGSCHLFRHTMATLMLEGGADIRFIQEMLGHALLDSTEIYTHVSIKKLKEIHSTTHPGAGLKASRTHEDAGPSSEELLSSLAAEVTEDETS